MSEYYIRQNASSEAQGPLSVSDLQTLAQAGKVTPQTEHFYDDNIGWQPIEANAGLKNELWPQKQKLSLKKSTPSPKPTVAPVAAPVRSVEEMLNASQGKTKATEHITKKKRWENKTASLSLPLLGVAHLAMGGLMLLGSSESLALLIEKQDPAILLSAPILIVAAILLLIGGALALSVAGVYPLARYMALFTMGYLCIQSWNCLYEGLSLGWGLLGAGIGFGLGFYITTVTLNFAAFCVSMVVAYAGIACYAWAALKLAALLTP